MEEVEEFVDSELEMRGDQQRLGQPGINMSIGDILISSNTAVNGIS